MQSINALFPYTWADFQSFGFSSFAWFVLRGVLNVFSWRASWILRSMTWFFTVALFLVRKEKKKSFLVSLESVHYLSNKSGYRCLCNCSTAVNCFIFRTLKKKKKKKLRTIGMYHSTCPKHTASMCGQLRHSSVATFRVCWMRTIWTSASLT